MPAVRTAGIKPAARYTHTQTALGCKIDWIPGGTGCLNWGPGGSTLGQRHAWFVDSGELIEQRLRLAQVVGIEPFGEPAVSLGQQRPGFGPATLPPIQAA